MTRIFATLLLLAGLAGAAAAQEPAGDLRAVLRLAQAEHWMVRVVTLDADTITGRIDRATTDYVRFQRARVSVPVNDIVLLEHGLHDETESRGVTGLIVIGAFLAAAGLMAMEEDPNLWLVVPTAAAAVAGMVWYSTTRQDESMAELLWVEEWPTRSPRVVR